MATPSPLRGMQVGSDRESMACDRLREIILKDVRVTVLADRDFGDTELYRFMEEELEFDYIIRFRDYILVTSKQGEEREASLWVPENGHAKTLGQVPRPCFAPLPCPARSSGN